MGKRFVMELSSKGTKSVGLFMAIGVLVFLFGPIASSTALAKDERILVVISPAQEVVWGEKALESFLETRRLSGDGNLALRIDRIGRRVAGVSDRPNHPYRFLLVEGDELQAFSFPGGTVCLTESLARLYPSDDELAFILGHELTHIVLRHHVLQLRMREATERGTRAEEGLLRVVKSRLDRGTEMEADRFGALYAVRAHFRFTSTYGALDRLEKASSGIKEDPAHPDYAERIAALKDFRRELERALGAFDRGLTALGGGNPDEAISMLNIFVAEYPNSVSGRLNLGAAHLARVRKNSGTPQGLSEVMPILPDPGIVVRSTVDVLDLYHARENFEGALRVRPGEVLAQAGLGLVHTRLGEYDQARSRLDQARSAAPTRPEFPLCRGNVEYLAGDYPRAASFYREALNLHPDWPEAMKNLAMTYEKQDEPVQARSLWSQLTGDSQFGQEAARRLRDLRD